MELYRGCWRHTAALGDIRVLMEVHLETWRCTEAYWQYKVALGDMEVHKSILESHCSVWRHGGAQRHVGGTGQHLEAQRCTHPCCRHRVALDALL